MLSYMNLIFMLGYLLLIFLARAFLEMLKWLNLCNVEMLGYHIL